VSNIPSNAISGALTPIQRASNEAVRARQIQSAKNFHHSEEVDELDDTAVNSVSDQSGGNAGRQNKRKKDDGTEEHVDIEALTDIPLAPRQDEAAPPSRLDISA
jgi:hypothetical protein